MHFYVEEALSTEGNVTSGETGTGGCVEDEVSGVLEAPVTALTIF